MPSDSELIQELNYLSETVSRKVWAISAGVMALCWALIVQEPKPIPILQLLVPVILAIVSLTFDLAQYIAGLRYNVALLRRLETQGLESVPYAPDAPLYRLRQAFFYGKLGFCLLAGGSLIVILGAYVGTRL